jgi:hypothetical protein
MVRNITFRLSLCCLTQLLYIPDISIAQNWPKIYGDSFNAYVNTLIENYDHGFLIGGSVLANPNTFRYAWIIKTDVNGNELWNKKFGNGVDQFYSLSISQPLNNELILCGGTALEDNQLDPFFLKLDVCGEPEWCKLFLCEGYNSASGVISLNDGYIGMLKYYGEDSSFARISLVKMDQYGEPIWIQRLAQDDSLINNEEGHYIYMTSDSNYLISGNAFHPGYRPFWILTDTSGTQIWDLFWNNLVGEAHQVIEKDSGIFYSTSWGIGSNGIQSPVLLKFNNSGNPIGSYYLMGDTIVEGSAVAINSLNETTLLIGLAWKIVPFPVDQGFSEIYLTDTLGNLIKRRVLLNEYQSPKRIFVDSDQKILVAGNYVVDGNWDIYLWKMNADLEDDSLYTQPMTYDSLCPYQITSDTVDLDCDLFVRIEDIPTKEEYESTIKMSPNPARDWIMLTFPDIIHDGKLDLAVYNLFGQEVLRKEATSANRMVTLDVSGLSSGLYVAVCIDQRKRVMKGKFLIAR